jgi:HEAT repeat protein
MPERERVALGTPSIGSPDLDPNELAEIEEYREKLLYDADPEERADAASFLTTTEGPDAVRALLEALGDSDPDVRLAVLEALSDFVEDLEPGALAPFLHDPSAEVRFEAVSLLGEMETPAALQMVRGYLDDPDEDVQALAEGVIEFATEE